MFKTLQYLLNLILGLILRCIRLIRTCLRTFGAERPTTTLVVVISVCVAILPFVTAAALMPLKMILDLSNALSTKGWLYVLYSLFFQVSILTLIICGLFTIAFTLASGLTILHKLNIFIK